MNVVTARAVRHPAADAAGVRAGFLLPRQPMEFTLAADASRFAAERTTAAAAVSPRPAAAVARGRRESPAPAPACPARDGRTPLFLEVVRTEQP